MLLFVHLTVSLTDNFDVDICRVLPSRVSDHNRVDSLVLPLGSLDGEDAVALGGLHADPPVSFSKDLTTTSREKLLDLLVTFLFVRCLCCT